MGVTTFWRSFAADLLQMAESATIDAIPDCRKRLPRSGLAALDGGGSDTIFDAAARRPALDKLAAARLEDDADVDEARPGEPVLDLAGCRGPGQTCAQQARVGGELGRQWRGVDHIGDDD